MKKSTHEDMRSEIYIGWDWVTPNFIIIIIFSLNVTLKNV